MVVLTPLGLIAPGGAFGEDAPEDLDLQKYHLDAVPSGLRHYAGSGTTRCSTATTSPTTSHPALGYLVSAVVGIAVIARGRRRDLRTSSGDRGERRPGADEELRTACTA